MSSPGNLIIGEGAAYVAWKAMNWTKNTFRTIRRQLNIVGKPIFPQFNCILGVVNAVRSGLQSSACVASAALHDFFSLLLNGTSCTSALWTFPVLLAHALFFSPPTAFCAVSRLRNRSGGARTQEWFHAYSYVWFLSKAIMSRCDSWLQMQCGCKWPWAQACLRVRPLS